MSLEHKNRSSSLPPIVSEGAVPGHLVQRGYRPGGVPKILIRGHGSSYNFTFYAPLSPGVLAEEVEGMFPPRGATGSAGYVQREARAFLQEILAGAYEEQRHIA